MRKLKKQPLKVEVNDANWNQRSPQAVVDRLNEEARQHKCSKNKLVNEILKRHLDLEDYPMIEAHGMTFVSKTRASHGK